MTWHLSKIKAACPVEQSSHLVTEYLQLCAITDVHGRTWLHTACAFNKPKLILEILKHPDVADVRRRDAVGETALDVYEGLLDAKRDGCDRRNGPAELTSPEAGALIALRKAMGIAIGRGLTVTRVRYGCTCGKCRDGYLSLRMKLRLIDAARNLSQFMTRMQQTGDHFDYDAPPASYLPKDVCRGKGRPFFLGYQAVFAIIDQLLQDGKNPRPRAIVQMSNRLKFKDFEFFRDGDGLVECCLKAVLDQSERQNEVVGGDGSCDHVYGIALRRFPACRNDDDYQVVRRGWLGGTNVHLCTVWICGGIGVVGAVG
ncbi:hypothetical protein HDV00_004311 [Rhizophlyctis rosea]|nr:hypothetical protein HDV00_004311 [Rhizophlyctis rosea]